MKRVIGSGGESLGAVALLLALAVALSGCAGGAAPAPATSAAPVTVAVTATAAAIASPRSTAGGGNADVVSVRAVEDADGTWTFHVTVRHPDTGWEDYADGWDVVTPDGRVLKPDPDAGFTRTLLHPHIDEQPFTRSQGSITVPQGVTRLRVRAHDLVDGWGGQEVVVDLEAGSGENFDVERQN